MRAACGQFGEVQEVMMVGGEHNPSCSGRGFGLVTFATAPAANACAEARWLEIEGRPIAVQSAQLKSGRSAVGGGAGAGVGLHSQAGGGGYNGGMGGGVGGGLEGGNDEQTIFSVLRKQA